MGIRRDFVGRLCISSLIIPIIAAVSFNFCDARRPMPPLKATKPPTISSLMITNKLGSSNAQPYGVSSPFSLPPFDALAPIPLPDATPPPICTYPPFAPHPVLPIQTPPSSPMGPNPPDMFPNPPGSGLSPPYYEPSPPSIFPGPPGPPYVPGPPTFVPSPPVSVPGPPTFVPSPPVFQPPVVYPPPTGPPPPRATPSITLWCVAKPSVPDPIIEEAMDYACGSGADCQSIQPSGSCYQPNTLLAHASYAFNSYWQRTKVAGGTCEFGGTAMLVSVDPRFCGP
ncbi:extensin isoform X2 [Malania oleifera]|uniref:extensin isoform X2 n=1 Tax=Malania oleifera TaxID=397392 RepID=UPI0025AEAB78|nr:extensin isoform X2 [Malania oleifera]